MLSAIRALLFIACAALTTTVIAAPEQGHALVRRDDNLPARVPYVFPAPGTDPVRDCSLSLIHGTELTIGFTRQHPAPQLASNGRSPYAQAERQTARWELE